MLPEVLLIMAGLMLATVGQWMVFDQTAPFFQAFDTHTKHEWVGRINATVVQSMLVVFALSYTKLSHWGWPLLLAYLLHDTGHMLIYERDLTAYLHHVVTTTVFGLTKLVMTEEQIDSTVRAFTVVESTSPVLHSSWLLRQAGYSNHPWFKYVAGFTAVFFGVMRCGVFPWTMTKMDTSGKLIFAPLLALNLYWFYKIVKIAMKIITKKDEPALNTSQSPST